MPSAHDDEALLEQLRFDVETLRLFDLIPDVHFFIKDAGGRLVHCNALHRHGLLRFESDGGVYGRENRDFFPAALAAAFADDDRSVIATGRSVVERVELNITHDGALTWFCTTKTPARDRRGRIVGLIGISRRLEPADVRLGDFTLLMPAIRHIHDHYRGTIRTQTLARLCRMASTTFQREFKSLLRISPGRFVIRVRIHEACLRLANSDQSVADVSSLCGFHDQNYFARQFKAVIGLTPTAYRIDSRTGEGGRSRISQLLPARNTGHASRVRESTRHTQKDNT